ncbi:hypothetical protein QWY16_09065 [Planococcus shenhongbingii]|uniref:Toxoflavin-degrading enzyme domain-containing protein n=1 Tax=Planococcus shenhongbingii TaxID=3058398 RepID=A0ABT8NCN5_9BACL|nr:MULTISPECIES: hypothetical protein [unclassified Planococcus (in: firmicutes)]MDN7245652.1 hypothetical protein [Planococcus sp. N017]WKA60457.1 hypothetical protein QWY16_09065 [Planococcus sp. N016]
MQREKDDIFFENIDAHSVYSYDPEENGAELIARHQLNPVKKGGHFSSRDIVDMAEMNLTTYDVADVGGKLGKIGIHETHHSPLNATSVNFLGEPEDGTHIF